MARAIDNSPKADHLMGSLRSMGYSFESAIADIIDNSVSAGAREIHINFPTTALESFVYILDDGHGMTKKEHFNAMRYGSSASESERDETDLGRYGLGMKSASLNEFQMMHRYNGYCSFSPGGGPDGKIMEKETPPVKGMFPFLHQMLPCIFRCIICNMGRIVSGCVPFTCSGIPTGSCRYAS